MYEMGRTMEQVSDSWIEVTTTNGNGPKELNLKEKLLKAQLGKIVVVMHAH
jgi:NifB/MoaA-like Fe-S oxidoreductase